MGPTTDLQTANNSGNYYDSVTTMQMLQTLTFGCKLIRFHGRWVEVLLNLQSIAFIVSNPKIEETFYHLNNSMHYR